MQTEQCQTMWSVSLCLSKGNARIVLILWCCEDLKLNGRLSEKLGKLSALEEIHLDHNFLRGSIPSQLGHLVAWDRDGWSLMTFLGP